MGGLGIVADGAHLIAEGRAAVDDPDDEGGGDGDDETEMQALALHELRQLRLGDDLLRLRPAEAHRILQRTFEQQADEQDDDEIEQQRGHHLIDAETGLEKGRDRKDQRAAQHRGKPSERE